MSTVLRAADRTRDGLIEVLAGLPADSSWRLWLEAPDGWTLSFWPGLAGEVRWYPARKEKPNETTRQLVDRAYSGRLFGPSGELRWRVLPVLGEPCCRCVFLGDEAAAPTGLEPHPGLDGLTPHSGKALLWGRQTKHTKDEWIELRVPHRFTYPVSAADSAAENIEAELELWKDAAGETHFVRLRGLRAWKKEV